MNYIHFTLKLVAFIGLLAATSVALAGSRVDRERLAELEALLSVPESQVDFAQAKLMIDQMIDPNTNIGREMMRLDRIVQNVKGMGDFSTSMEKKNALRRYLYEAGIWNQDQPFIYDFNDPKGTNITNKLTGTYLTSKKGNCVSMPFLFIVLGQKLGLDVAASTAPTHVFVKYTDDATGTTYNLEATSGANPVRDSWLRQNMPMTDKAVKNGVYLKKLTRQETVAVMADSLLQHYFEQKEFGQVIGTADLILKYYPKAVSAVIWKASAFNQILKAHDLWRYRSPMEVPLQKRDTFKFLVSNANRSHNQAVSMGWRQPSQAKLKKTPI